jgi:hypothetical protein
LSFLRPDAIFKLELGAPSPAAFSNYVLHEVTPATLNRAESRSDGPAKEIVIMSAQNADALLRKLIENPSLKSKLQAGGAAGFEKVANEAGLPCSKEDFSNALKAYVVKQDVFGGKSGTFATAAGSINAVGIGIV